MPKILFLLRQLKKEISVTAFVTFMHQNKVFNLGPLFEYNGLRRFCWFV